MKWFFSTALTIIGLSALAFYFSVNNSVSKNETATAKTKKTKALDEHAAEMLCIKNFGTSIETFAKNENYNTRYCFLVDMKRPSGYNRFFIYDMKADSVLDEGLVAHGSGLTENGDNVQFSNKPSSYCSSLGKYKIGKSYNGSFGLAYKLYGLDKTNDQAFKRFIVLHGHRCVPDAETAPEPICQSWGCPTVAPSFLNKLATYIDKAEKPILLWIFN